MSQLDAASSSPTWRTQEILIGGLQHAAGVALVLGAWVLVFTDHARAAGSALLPGLFIVNSGSPLPPGRSHAGLERRQRGAQSAL